MIGATDTDTQSVSVTAPANQAPTAAFTSSCTDLTCDFNASTSSDPDGTIASFAWSFGGNGAVISNTYASAGTYSVTLTVTDNEGASDQVTQSVSVTEPPVGGNDITMTLGENNAGNKIKVFWTDATTSKVDIYRNGSFYKRTRNDGLWNDKNVSIGTSYTYQVCNQRSNSFCSNIDRYTV